MSPTIPPKVRQNLTEKVVFALRERIQKGQLDAGAKLPTEQQLIVEFSVSRTVIREAISALKADKLVESRQGAGVFVLAASAKEETFAFLQENLKTISSVIEALELRAAVEVGAAELAAQRCSPAQEAALYAKFNCFQEKVMSGEVSEAEDFAFHIAIAKATNNQKFIDFLTLLGRNTIPRSDLRLKANLQRDPDLEQQILNEHKMILEAISARDPKRASQAMHQHLSQGAERYRHLARKAQTS